jgi:predicted SnoaL-like aldol condensation-catalyzing enzyme
MMRIRILAGLVFAGLLSSPLHAADCEANKATYRSYMEQVWNKHDPSAVDRYLAPDYVEHNPNLPPGRDGRWGFVSKVLAAFPDYHAEIQEVVADGDRVVARVQWTGTQDGPYEGRPPTHNKLVFWTADFFRFENGKIAEHWDVVDRLPRMIALGLVPPPAAPKPAK